MTRDEAIAFLTADGNLAVPCSRYGHDSESCAPVAYDLAVFMEEANGDPVDAEMLDYCMGLVVNDHDDVAGLLYNE